MVTKFVEIVKTSRYVSSEADYTLREVFVNPTQVTMLREDTVMKNLLREGKLPDELDKRMEFTRVYLNTGADLYVVGAPHLIETKLKQRQILKG